MTPQPIGRLFVNQASLYPDVGKNRCQERKNILFQQSHEKKCLGHARLSSGSGESQWYFGPVTQTTSLFSHSVFFSLLWTVSPLQDCLFGISANGHAKAFSYLRFKDWLKHICSRRRHYWDNQHFQTLVWISFWLVFTRLRSGNHQYQQIWNAIQTARFSCFASNDWIRFGSLSFAVSFQGHRQDANWLETEIFSVAGHDCVSGAWLWWLLTLVCLAKWALFELLERHKIWRVHRGIENFSILSVLCPEKQIEFVDPPAARSTWSARNAKSQTTPNSAFVSWKTRVRTTTCRCDHAFQKRVRCPFLGERWQRAKRLGGLYPPSDSVIKSPAPHDWRDTSPDHTCPVQEIEPWLWRKFSRSFGWSRLYFQYQNHVLFIQFQ